MKKIQLCFVLVMLLLTNQNALMAQSYDSYSQYMYHFIKYISWPQESAKEEFIIGVLGPSPVYDELEYLAASKKAGQQKITVKKFSDIKHLGACQMLFIPAAQANQLEACAQALKGKATLIITEGPGMTRRGSCISFIQDAGRLRFELNKNAAENAGMRVLSDLVKLSTPANSRR